MLTNRRNRASADTRHCLCLGPTNLASISYLKGPHRETILTHQSHGGERVGKGLRGWEGTMGSWKMRSNLVRDDGGLPRKPLSLKLLNFSSL